MSPGGGARVPSGGAPMAKRRKLDLDGPFVLHSLEMRESPAWRALSDTARRVLDRLEVEHINHGGAENGSLVCTYDDFCKAGIRRKSISRAIRECVALGFLEVTQQGGLVRADIRRPSNYRLTYVNGRHKSPDPTHEWRKLVTEEQASAIVIAIAREVVCRRQKFFPGGENATAPEGAKTPLHSRGENAPGSEGML